MAEEITQQQFDWAKDSADLVEGLKFDIGVDYAFVLDEFSKHDMRKKGSTTPILYKKGDRAGQPVLMYTATFKEQETSVKFKLDFFVQERYRVNEAAPETEDDFVAFSRKLGYNPVLGGHFSPADFIHLGTQITAQLKEQPQTDADKAAGKKPYNMIDVKTIVLGEDGGSGSSADAPSEISDDVISELQKMIDTAPKCKKFADLAGKINKLAAKDKSKFELLEPAMRANDQHKLKF